ncbi:MAG: MerR family transcriptional regulator [Bacillota bacterium]|nr:MerR family transcriptional regulator [Bacillota bacterium]
MKINEVAKLTGVTVRTIQYYDKIGLLKPSGITEAGYRLYNNEALEILQQILFFKELDFPLNEIKEIMTHPNYDKQQAMNKHKELLIKKRRRLDKLINLIENTTKGEFDMSFKEFDMTEIEAAKEQYAEEVKQRWGDTEAYAESERKTSGYDKEKWKIINSKGDAILNEFAQIKSSAPNSEIAQELVKKWQDYITESFYNCTKEILSGLGLMYLNDERFTKNIDKHGSGTAEFMAKAIGIYCAE